MSSRKNRKKFSKSPLDAPVKPESKDKKEKTFYFEPKTENQKKYVESINKNTITFCVGPAGSGKSFCALSIGITMLMANQVEKIIIIRPLIQTKYSEQKIIGATPGSLNDKVKEYLMGVWDSAEVIISKELMNSFVANGTIEILPLSLVRGRSFHSAFIIIEEAQNIEYGTDAMRMALTRIGKGSKMIINGDISQSDLGIGKKSALEDAIKRFKDVAEFGVVKLEKIDIQRNGIIKVILDKYEN